MASDVILGNRIHDVLIDLRIETPMVQTGLSPQEKFKIFELAQTSNMHALGLNQNDDSLKGTPSRIARMYSDEVFYGLDYNNFPACTAIENKMKYDEVIASKRIDVLSMCEHHFVPFIGYAFVAYIPNTKVLGLSKFNRVVDFFARRPQVQERLTEQCYAAFATILETQDIAIVIDASHLCVRLRGVKQANGSTVTSKLGGRFKSVPALRSEFFALTR